MELHDQIYKLIIRLLSGKATLTEKNQISDWIKLSEENKQLFFELRDIWLISGSSNNADDYNLDGAINQFLLRIRHPGNKFLRRLSVQNILKYAAVAVLLLALPFSFHFLGKSGNTDSSMTTISCAFGDKTNIVLPDNSVVYLNSGSRLSYSSDFGMKSRSVFLEGEAFFDVTSDSKHPFRVKTNDVEVKVLGTMFNVKAYPEEEFVSTTLVEGSVSLYTADKEVHLNPYEKAVFNKADNKLSIKHLTDIAPETEWKDGRFIFRNESLEELTPRLERWFDVDIEFADEMAKKRKFTGILVRESILEAVGCFNYSNLIECGIQGNKIIIKSEKK
jgi:ferric-dicitrate binding protein FerR (iron transport regulator)